MLETSSDAESRTESGPAGSTSGKGECVQSVGGGGQDRVSRLGKGHEGGHPQWEFRHSLRFPQTLRWRRTCGTYSPGLQLTVA